MMLYVNNFCKLKGLAIPGKEIWTQIKILKNLTVSRLRQTGISSEPLPRQQLNQLKIGNAGTPNVKIFLSVDVIEL
jgi:hypothetical protein